MATSQSSYLPFQFSVTKGLTAQISLPFFADLLRIIRQLSWNSRWPCLTPCLPTRTLTPTVPSARSSPPSRPPFLPHSPRPLLLLPSPPPLLNPISHPPPTRWTPSA